MHLTRTKILQRCACLLGLAATLFISSCANTNIPERPKSILPARFSDSPASLQNRIRFPDIEGDVSATIRCMMRVNRLGWVKRTLCYAPDSSLQSVKLENAIHKAGRWARIKPASVNREAKAVWMPLSVHFTQKNGEQGIQVVPNFGAEIDRFGDDYFAPQRREVKLGEKKGRFFRGCTFHTKLWVEVTVDTWGVPLASAYPVGNGTDACKERFRQEIMHERFIPAIVNQQPVQATFFAPFLDVTHLKQKQN